MSTYNLIQYSDNYADLSESLYQFKRDESRMNDVENPLNVGLDNSASFKYKASLLGEATHADGNERSLNKRKISCSTEIFIYLFMSLETHLINFKIHVELNCSNNCAMYDAYTYADGDNANNRETTFKITSTKMYVPIVTLSTKDNADLTKQLSEGFSRSVYWSNINQKYKYKKQIPTILKYFLFLILFKELIGFLFLLLAIQIMVLIELKEIIIENIFSQESISLIIMY